MEKFSDPAYSFGNLQYSGHAFSSESAELFNKKIWRVKDVASLLGCSVGHVYNLTSDEKIPNRKKGKLLFFIPQEILDWILKGD